MKIGLIRWAFSATGGAENYLLRFARALVNEGHECILFGSPAWERSGWDLGEFRAIEARTPLGFATELDRAEPERFCDLTFSLERIRACDCYRAGDGVHRCWLRRRAALEPGWKSLLRGMRAKDRQILKLEERLFNGGTNKIIANSEFVRKEILQSFEVSPDSIAVVYNGIPFEPETDPGDMRSRMRENMGFKDDEYIVLFAGSGWERKGLRFAAEAMEGLDLPWTRLLVVGEGRRRRYRKDRTEFLGPVTDFRSYLAAADVFLLPTIYDPFSNACLEAAGAGLPVITTSANGFSEVIKSGEHGTVINNPSDTTSIRKALTAWSDPGRRTAARPKIRELARRYDIEKNVKETLEILTSLR